MLTATWERRTIILRWGWGELGPILVKQLSKATQLKVAKWSKNTGVSKLKAWALGPLWAKKHGASRDKPSLNGAGEQISL